MRSFLLLPLLLMVLISCRKSSQEARNALLDGTWKMTAVENIVTGTVITKDAADVSPYCRTAFSCDVILEIKGSGDRFSLVGHTITNALSGNLVAGDNGDLQMSLGLVTKLGDARWSHYLVANSPTIKSYEARAFTLYLYFNQGTERLVFVRG